MWRSEMQNFSESLQICFHFKTFIMIQMNFKKKAVSICFESCKSLESRVKVILLELEWNSAKNKFCFKN